MSRACRTEHSCKYDEGGHKWKTVVNRCQPCAHNMTKGATNSRKLETDGIHFPITEGNIVAEEGKYLTDPMWGAHKNVGRLHINIMTRTRHGKEGMNAMSHRESLSLPVLLHWFTRLVIVLVGRIWSMWLLGAKVRMRNRTKGNAKIYHEHSGAQGLYVNGRIRGS